MAYRTVVAGIANHVEGWRLGEGSGTTAESVNNTADGTISGSPTLGATGLLSGDADTAITFDGSDDQINCGNPAGLQLSTGTLVAWVKTTQSASYRDIATKKFAYGLLVKDGELMVYDWGAGADRLSGFSVDDNAIHMVALRWESAASNGSTLWADGSTRATFTYTVNAQTSAFVIGNEDSASQWFAGTVDEVDVWSRKLTDQELEDLYTEGTGGGGGALTAGTLSVTGTTSDSVSLSITGASGGTSPYTYQLERAPDSSGSPGSYSTVGSPQSGTTWTDDDGGGGLAPGTYWWRVLVTDDATDTDTSNAVSEEVGAPDLTLGTLTTVAMARSIAYDLTFTGDSGDEATCAVEWSADGGTTWVDFLPGDHLNDGSGTKRFRGMAGLDLEPATEHTLRLTISHPGVISGTNPVTAVVTTKAAAVTAPATVLAGTIDYYVRPDGNDSNTGTSNTSGGAWKTIGKALGSATSGAVVQVLASGTTSYTLNDHGRSTPITLIASNPACDDDGALTAGDHAVLEHSSTAGTNAITMKVSGPTGSSSTYPQVTEAPWTSDGTILDNEGVTRTVYYWDTDYQPTHVGYSTTRFGDLYAVAPNVNMGAATVNQWKAWLADNPSFHSGHFYDSGTGRVYLVLPDHTLNPNDLYLTLSGGYGLFLNGATIRVCGFVFRGFWQAVRTYDDADGVTIDHCDFQQNTAAIAPTGNKEGTPHLYGTNIRIAHNRCWWGNLWSDSQERTGTHDHTAINWGFIKGGVTDGVLNINKPAETAESYFLYLRGGAHGVTAYQNVVSGPFNGIAAYGADYDEWAGFAVELYDNTLRRIADDAFEPEQVCSAWAIWHNRIERSSVGISTGPVNYGPLYLVRNTFWRLGAEGGGQNDAGNVEVGSCLWKYGGGPSPTSRVYWLHNTAWTDRLAHATPLTGVDGWQHNAGGADEYVTAYNNAIHSTRYATAVPNGAQAVLAGNYFVTTDEGIASNSGLEFNESFYTTNVSAFATAYNTLTGRSDGATNNTVGDFLSVATFTAALEDPENGDLTPVAASDFLDAGVLIPNFSVEYPGSGTVRVWHYADDGGDAPDIGAIELALLAEDEEPETATVAGTLPAPTGTLARTAATSKSLAGALPAMSGALSASLTSSGPVISDAEIASFTATTATVTWTTDVEADSQVEYATDAEWAGAPGEYPHSTILNPTLTTEHVVQVTGLTPSTGYHLRARSATEA